MELAVAPGEGWGERVKEGRERGAGAALREARSGCEERERRGSPAGGERHEAGMEDRLTTPEGYLYGEGSHRSHSIVCSASLLSGALHLPQPPFSHGARGRVEYADCVSRSSSSSIGEDNVHPPS